MENSDFKKRLLYLANVAQANGWECTLAYLKHASESHKWESDGNLRSTNSHKMKESPVHVEEEKDSHESTR